MATDGRKVLELAAMVQPDVVVMEVGMPGINGIEVTRRLVARQHKVKVIALSSLAHNHALEIIEAGASTYIIKENDMSELLCALHEIMKGKKHLCPQVSEAVVNYSGRFRNENAMKLGSREREVLQLVAEGTSTPDIAKQLSISASTVDVHRRNIMTKLDLHNVAELTKYAVRNGLTVL